MATYEFEVDEGVHPLVAWREGASLLARELGLDPLGKAVPAHPSQFAQRTRLGRFTERLPHHAVPRGPQGEFRQRLTRSECREASRAARALVEEQVQPRLADHLADWRAGHIDPAEWKRRCEREIRYFYEAAYREGKRAVGDPGIVLTPTDKAVVNRLVADEVHYLEGFEDHLASGGGKMSYEDRMDLYARATFEAFWNGWTMGDLRKQRMIKWVLGETEHCADCLRFSDLGWVPIERFVTLVLRHGFSPRSGQLECGGWNCKCRLRERVDGQEFDGLERY